MNVFDLQMHDSAWRLAARVDGTVVIPGYVVKESATTWGLWFYPFPGMELPLRFGGPFAVGTGRFPYGIDVEPDS